MAFHENLRVLRLATGLTQPALAETAEIEQSYLSKLENGRSSPSDEVLQRLASALGTTAEELMRNGGDGASTRSQRAALAGAAVALALIAAAVGWFANDALRPQREPGAGPDRSYGSLAERLDGAAPAGLKVEQVSIDDDGTITLAGRTADRAAFTAYLGELRRSGIGEATMMMLTDNDTRFHLIVAPYPSAAAATPEQAAAGAKDHALVMARFEAFAGAGVDLQRLTRSRDGSFFAAGVAREPVAVAVALDALEREGYRFVSRKVEGDASGARFEFVFHAPAGGGERKKT